MFLADWRTPTILDQYVGFVDFFTERSQHVRVCDDLSGVPQGRVLSLLLFLPDSNKCHHLSVRHCEVYWWFGDEFAPQQQWHSVALGSNWFHRTMSLERQKTPGCLTTWAWWLMIAWPPGGCSVQESSPKDFGGKLWVFNTDGTFMRMFYSCFIESILTFSLICCYGLASSLQTAECG